MIFLLLFTYIPFQLALTLNRSPVCIFWQLARLPGHRPAARASGGLYPNDRRSGALEPPPVANTFFFYHHPSCCNYSNSWMAYLLHTNLETIIISSWFDSVTITLVSCFTEQKTSGIPSLLPLVLLFLPHRRLKTRPKGLWKKIISDRFLHSLTLVVAFGSWVVDSLTFIIFLFQKVD